MVVGARVEVPALVGGLTVRALVPYFVSIGRSQAGEPFRKITFLIALGMMLGGCRHGRYVEWLMKRRGGVDGRAAERHER
jgi:hypothetical protein